MHSEPVHRAAELAARSSYGKLVAILAMQNRDIAGAEDALSEALLSALDVWPAKGVPDVQRRSRFRLSFERPPSVP